MKRRLIIIFTAIVGFVAASYIGLVFFTIYQEQGLSEKSRLHRVKADIAGIESALRLFHKHNGRYPKSLNELEQQPEGDIGDQPWRITIPLSPWHSPYQYMVSSQANAETYKVSV